MQLLRHMAVCDAQASAPRVAEAARQGGEDFAHRDARPDEGHACGALVWRSRAQQHRHRRHLRAVRWGATLGTPPGLALHAMKENHSEKSIMDTPAAPWCSAHVPPDTNDSIGITELHKAPEEPIDPHIPAVPFLRHSDLLQLRMCSQRHRHLAQHLTAPQDLRTPVQLCAHDPCGTLSCEQVCTSGTRMEPQVNQVQANIIENHRETSLRTAGQGGAARAGPEPRRHGGSLPSGCCRSCLGHSAVCGGDCEQALDQQSHFGVD